MSDSRIVVAPDGTERDFVTEEFGDGTSAYFNHRIEKDEQGYRLRLMGNDGLWYTVKRVFDSELHVCYWLSAAIDHRKLIFRIYDMG